MGSSLNIKCTNCNLDQPDFNVGSGRLSISNWEPAFCKFCDHVVRADKILHGDTCPDCRQNGLRYYFENSYKILRKMTDPDLELPKLWKITETARDVPYFPKAHTSEDQKRYLCPRCGKFELQFKKGDVLWD